MLFYYCHRFIPKKFILYRILLINYLIYFMISTFLFYIYIFLFHFHIFQFIIFYFFYFFRDLNAIFQFKNLYDQFFIDKILLCSIYQFVFSLIFFNFLKFPDFKTIHFIYIIIFIFLYLLNHLS